MTRRFIELAFSRAMAVALTIGMAEAAAGVVESDFVVRIEIASPSGEVFVVRR